MIKIIRNANFSEWFNVMVNGVLVDNARTHAKAMQIAETLRKDLPSSIATGARINKKK